MTDLIVILPTLAAIISIISLIISLLKFYKKSEAEKTYIELLNRKKNSINKMFVKHHPDFKFEIKFENLDEQELELLMNLLSDIANSLPNDKKHYIKQPLIQTSPIGKMRYIKKILDKAGVFNMPLTNRSS